MSKEEMLSIKEVAAILDAKLKEMEPDTREMARTALENLNAALNKLPDTQEMARTALENLNAALNKLPDTQEMTRTALENLNAALNKLDTKEIERAARGFKQRSKHPRAMTKKNTSKGPKKTTEPAQNVEAFREKYGRSYFDPLSVGKGVILNYLYETYQVLEQIPDKEIKPLFDKEKLKQKLETTQHYIYYSYYLTLWDWLTFAYGNAVNTSYTLKTQGVAILSLLNTLITGEHIEKEIEKTGNLRLQAFAHSISLKKYAPGEEYSSSYKTLRDGYQFSLRYLKAYNLFIDLLAEAQGIPELVVFKENTNTAEQQRKKINETLQKLMETAEKFRINDDPTKPLGEYTDYTHWSHNYLESVRDFYSAIPDAEDIPEENIKNTMEVLRTPPHYHVSWQWVFNWIFTKADYWRRGR